MRAIGWGGCIFPCMVMIGLMVLLLIPSGTVQAVPSIVFDASGIPNPVSCVNSSCSSISWSHTVGPGGSNGILIVGVSWRGPVVVPTVKFGATALTFLGSHNNIGDQAGLWSMAVSSGASGMITVTFSSTVTFIVGASASYFNVAGTGTFALNDGSSTAASVSVASSSGDRVVDTLAVSNLRVVSVPGTSLAIAPTAPGQVQLWKMDGPSFTDGLGDFFAGGGSDQPASGSTTTMSWSITTGSTLGLAWSLVAIPLIPATTATTTATSSGPPIPEYPLGLPLIVLLTVIAYSMIKRGTTTKAT